MIRYMMHTHTHTHTHTNLFLLPQDKYRGDLQSVYRDLSEAHLTPPLVARQLAKLNEATTLPIQWAELTELSSLPDSSLFQDGFIGFDILKETLEDLMVGVCIM